MGESVEGRWGSGLLGLERPRQGEATRWRLRRVDGAGLVEARGVRERGKESRQKVAGEHDDSLVSATKLAGEQKASRR